MLTKQQLRNRQARDAGDGPGASYRTDLRRHDRVRLLIVDRDPSAIRVVAGRLLSIEDHGHYATLVIQNGQVEPEAVTLWREPPDWGCVECRVVERWQNPPRPDRWR